MLYRITPAELVQAQVALFLAIGLQMLSRYIGGELLPGTQYLIIAIEITLAVLLAITINTRSRAARGAHHYGALILLGLISMVNISSLVYVLHSLILTQAVGNGVQLLAAAIVIFITNIIVYALWYWEIDSPGLTRTKWSKHDKDFQFTQQDLAHEFPGWRPQFADYVYVSVTNAINFAPADTRPLTRPAKMLMASQALVSVFTLALVIARSVSILGS
jgi:uncharacterized membrane protein